tara:strand:- start:8708 stop:8989 length:282 start_codon:yes stop_codon:yes gene_type:complete
MKDKFEILHNIIDCIKIVKKTLKSCHPDNEDFLKGQLSTLETMYEFIFEKPKMIDISDCISHTPIERFCDNYCIKEVCISHIMPCVCSKCKNI